MNGIARQWRKQKIRMLRSIVWSQRCNEQISAVGGIERMVRNQFAIQQFLFLFLCISQTIVSFRFSGPDVVKDFRCYYRSLKLMEVD